MVFMDIKGEVPSWKRKMLWIRGKTATFCADISMEFAFINTDVARKEC